MAATQPPTTPAGIPGGSCASCGSPLAADQRYCLSCGARQGEPRVAAAGTPPAQAPPGAVPAAPQQARQADVSPLAAVIGIALLGGMLLIGVLIGRGSDEPPPAPVVQVGEASPSSTTPGGSADGGAPTTVASEWPPGTDGFTIQLTTLAKGDATPETVDAAEQKAVADGAADAAVLDSDLYASLPPGNYVVYSGVFTDRKSAEVALKSLRASFPEAAVVEVSSGVQEPDTDAAEPGGGNPSAGGEDEAPAVPDQPQTGVGG